MQNKPKNPTLLSRNVELSVGVHTLLSLLINFDIQVWSRALLASLSSACPCLTCQKMQCYPAPVSVTHLQTSHNILCKSKWQLIRQNSLMYKCKWLAYEIIQLQQPYSSELEIYRSHLPARNGIMQNLDSMWYRMPISSTQT